MSRKLILVVDDEPIIRETLVELLEYEGYEAICANNGRQALDLMESSSRKPDLILLDQMMPYMTGTEMVEALKPSQELSRIPVILISAAHNAKEVAQRAGLPLVPKPLEAGMLLRAITRISNQ